MTVQIPFPAIAIAPRRGAMRKCIVLRHTELNLAEVDADRAPVVLNVSGLYVPEVEAYGGTVPIRMHDGRLYRPRFNPADEASALDDPLRRNSVYAPVIDRIWDDLGNRDGGMRDPWPPGIENLLKSGNRTLYPAAAKAFDTSAKVGTEADAADGIAEWERFFLAGLEDDILIDGAVWTRTPEPCYMVSVFGDGFISAVIPRGVAKTPYDDEDLVRYDSRCFFFPADRLDEAKAFLAARSAKPDLILGIFRSANYGIEIIDEAALTTDFNAVGIRVLAADLLSALRPTGLATRLSEALEATDPFTGQADPISEIVTDILEALDEDQVSLCRGMDFASVAMHLARWDERPIEIDPSGHPGTGPTR